MVGVIRYRVHAIVVLVALALGLGACGGGGDDGGTTTGTPSKPQLRGDLVVGIGEQQTAMFDSPLFKPLGITHARLVIGYDATKVRFERDVADAWIAAARRTGVEPFITFGHSRVKPKKLPSVAEFRSDFRAFRERYPDVKVYAPWNEINHASQPTSRDPERAAAYYNVVKSDCRGCTVLAGDVLDQGGMVRYVRRYKRALHGTPRIWGLHNYADANRFRDSGLRDLLKAVPGDVWLTETGGIVTFGRSFPTDLKRAARATKYVLDLASKAPRVKRVYLYNWTGSPPDARFDAGLVGPDGKPRPAYDTLKALLPAG
jgi:hypothetical protein